MLNKSKYAIDTFANCVRRAVATSISATTLTMASVADSSAENRVMRLVNAEAHTVSVEQTAAIGLCIGWLIILDFARQLCLMSLVLPQATLLTRRTMEPLLCTHK